MILNYTEFLNESANIDNIVDLITNLTRNYDSTNTFNTDTTHFILNKEYKNWRDPKEVVKLEKTITHEAIYELNFDLDKKTYNLTCEFNFSFFGKHEKDSPDTGFDSPSNNRLAVILDGIDVKKLKIKSELLNFKSKHLEKPVKTALETFLIKMMNSDYDSLSAKIYKIEQTN